MAQGNLVAYYRVSTVRQGRSGLGLDAQRKAVADFLNGGSWQLTAECSAQMAMLVLQLGGRM